MRKIGERKLEWLEYYRASPFNKNKLEVTGEEWFKFLAEEYKSNEFIDMQMYLLANSNCIFRMKNNMNEPMGLFNIIIEIYA